MFISGRSRKYKIDYQMSQSKSVNPAIRYFYLDKNEQFCLFVKLLAMINLANMGPDLLQARRFAMALTMIGFGIGFVVGGFLVLSLVCIHMARKYGDILESRLITRNKKALEGSRV